MRKDRLVHVVNTQNKEVLVGEVAECGYVVTSVDYDKKKYACKECLLKTIEAYANLSMRHYGTAFIQKGDAGASGGSEGSWSA
jgi:hypothetical protein